ncbi:MAG: helix-turn-helix domain-containing protein [Thermodesulfovibrio sp.]|nr:helix-turn-helix domain-containing protein [Thermodesulfovibrio sp.]MDW7972443.1 helix-turn-helix transcriptional regulator [Thermodesulfovibrio sp.]
MRERHLIIEAIKLLRELQGIKQIDLVNALGITKSAYSQFEAGKASLSQENILAACELLGINKEWIEGKSDIFLYSNDILYLKAKNKEKLHKFMIYSKNVSYLHVVKPETFAKYLLSKVFLQEFVVTFARFENETYCVILTPTLRSSNDFYDYFESMYKTLETVNIPYSYCFLENFEDKKEILTKVETRTITKEDIMRLYSLANVATMNVSLSAEEKELILKLREKKKSPKDVLSLFEKL